MIDRRRGLLLATTLLAAGLGGCDWLGWGDSTPARAQNVRPGMERAVPASSALPAAGSHSYDASIVPVDDRGGQIGSIVAGKGGQKAQQDAVKKEEAERDAKARAERERDRQASTDKAPGANEPPTEPVAPAREPVSATPVAPPVGAPTKPTE
jgi:hypothetical protein